VAARAARGARHEARRDGPEPAAAAQAEGATSISARSRAMPLMTAAATCSGDRVPTREAASAGVGPHAGVLDEARKDRRGAHAGAAKVVAEAERERPDPELVAE